jgi:jumonji domain-containing protein 2
MSPHNGYMTDTPVFRPSKDDFSKPFCDYVNKVLKKHPDIPMFKVVPPEGWKPRK